MKDFRPLFLQEINASLPGIRVHRLRLNRRLPEASPAALHRHPFAQILCYLHGTGWMNADGQEYELHSSSVLVLPPRCPHTFRSLAGRHRPLCLVIDLDWRGAAKRGLVQSRLSGSEIGRIKKELSELARLSSPSDPSCRLMVASTAFRILDILLQNLSVLPPRQGQMPAFVRQYERLVHESQGHLPSITDLAAKMGYQKDYLNRLFKQASGLTLREYRDTLLLRKAKNLLRENSKVSTVAGSLGFEDSNYFSRWFKRQTGMQPKAFQGSHAST